MVVRLVDGEDEVTLWNSLRFWGGLLVMAGLGRAASYALRPPAYGTLSAEVIFTVLHPMAWVVLLIAESLMMVLGLLSKRITPLFVGSFLGVLFHLTFAYNLFVASIDRQDSGWAGVIPLIIVAAVHGYVVWVLGPRIRRKLDKEEEGG